MPDSDLSPDLSALIGSRICHDLISPLGAIGNGVELLAMSSASPGPEMELISQSVTNANARIRFFRVAFGAAGPGQHIGQPEITSILSDMTRGGRLSIDWIAQGSQQRAEVKLAFLAIQCLETGLPRGGCITVSREGGGWRIGAEAERIRLDPDLWALIEGRRPTTDLAASAVQFALLPAEARRQGRALTLSRAEDRIAIGF